MARLNNGLAPRIKAQRPRGPYHVAHDARLRRLDPDLSERATEAAEKQRKAVTRSPRGDWRSSDKRSVVVGGDAFTRFSWHQPRKWITCLDQLLRTLQTLPPSRNSIFVASERSYVTADSSDQAPGKRPRDSTTLGGNEWLSACALIFQSDGWRMPRRPAATTCPSDVQPSQR